MGLSSIFWQRLDFRNLLRRRAIDMTYSRKRLNILNIVDYEALNP
jgi:hypothetical protein